MEGPYDVRRYNTGEYFHSDLCPLSQGIGQGFLTCLFRALLCSSGRHTRCVSRLCRKGRGDIAIIQALRASCQPLNPTRRYLQLLRSKTGTAGNDVRTACLCVSAFLQTWLTFGICFPYTLSRYAGYPVCLLIPAFSLAKHSFVSGYRPAYKDHLLGCQI